MIRIIMYLMKSVMFIDEAAVVNLSFFISPVLCGFWGAGSRITKTGEILFSMINEFLLRAR
jgi:hypothetical protein